MDSVEKLLDSIDERVPRAPEQLFSLVYDELRKLARDRLNREAPGQT